VGHDVTTHPSRITIYFNDADLATAGRLAESLRDWIGGVDRTVSAERQRVDSSSMDFGTSLVVLFGAPAVVAVAGGIEGWLKAHHSAKITIVTGNQKQVVENITSNNAVKIIEVLKADS
jgi:hypothetical protein